MGGIDLSAVNARSLGHSPRACAQEADSCPGAQEELGPEEGKDGMGEPGASPRPLRGCQDSIVAQDRDTREE